jgi:hypothetical protein
MIIVCELIPGPSAQAITLQVFSPRETSSLLQSYDAAGNFWASATMPSNHSARTALFTGIACILLVVVAFASPFISYSVRTHYWEHKIKAHQDPEELRAWAVKLLVIYSSSNFADIMPGRVTNRPPATIPTSGLNPRIFVQGNQRSSSGLGHITLEWEEGSFKPMWGIDIGDTNFVTSHKNPEMWVSGIYFFVEPP